MFALLSDFNSVNMVTKPVASGTTIAENQILVLDSGAFRPTTAADAGKAVFVAFGSTDSYDVQESNMITAAWGEARYAFDSAVIDGTPAEGTKLMVTDGGKLTTWAASATPVPEDAFKACGIVEEVSGDKYIVRLF
jgi:hypothetical protein